MYEPHDNDRPYPTQPQLVDSVDFFVPFTGILSTSLTGILLPPFTGNEVGIYRNNLLASLNVVILPEKTEIFNVTQSW